MSDFPSDPGWLEKAVCPNTYEDTQLDKVVLSGWSGYSAS